MINKLFTVIGGLAIFIYGMQLMGDGLKNVAGQRMRSILRLFAKNRYVAVITGAGVTSVIQSSCATTVMTVGFVNAGLLTLHQAIGIILGSHVGTTITGQLVAFKISFIIMPAITIGLLMNFPKNRTIRNWGLTVMGFGFLFLGMELMSGQLRELSKTEFVQNIFRTFCCEPVNGSMPILATIGAITIGIVSTIVIQSSSACSGIVIVLATNGLLDLYTASAIVIGSNIGTTITAQVAAITANRVAKQAALSHTLTSTLGTILVTISFLFTIDGEPIFFKFVKFCSGEATVGRQIANANTFFNLFSTLLFIPFINQFASLCQWIIPVARAEVKFQRLEPHLLNTPDIALAQTTSAIRKMLKKSWTMVEAALFIYDKNTEANQRIIKQLEKREEDVDSRQQEIADYLSKLMQRQLNNKQARQIPMLLHCSNDAERIGDHTFIICSIMDRLKESELKFSPSATEEYDSLCENLGHLSETVIQLLEKKTSASIQLAKEMKLDLDDKLAQYESDHLKRISDGKCVPEVGIMYLELLEEIRKISRHLSNITDRADYFYDKLAKIGKLPLDETAPATNA